MQFLSLRILMRRIKSLSALMRDKEVPKRKKALVIAGMIYLFMPLDLIPPVIFPFGFVDDLVLWLWIIWHLKDELDRYQDSSAASAAEEAGDFSARFKQEDIVDGVSFSVDREENDE